MVESRHVPGKCLGPDLQCLIHDVWFWWVALLASNNINADLTIILSRRGFMNYSRCRWDYV